PVLEPIPLLLAFGLGLGRYMSSGIQGNGRSVGYMNFVAPGMVAYATFMTAIFQSLFGAFIRMRYQRTWEGQLTTQIELRHVVWGEILWAGLLTTSYVAIVGLVLSSCQALGLLQLELAYLPVVIPIVFVSACAFASLGLCFTALLQKPIDDVSRVGFGTATERGRLRLRRLSELLLRHGWSRFARGRGDEIAAQSVGSGRRFSIRHHPTLRLSHRAPDGDG